MRIIPKPLPEHLVSEKDLNVGFFDNLRVQLNDENQTDEPVLDENCNKIYDLFVMVVPSGDPYTKIVKLAEDSVKKAKGEKDFEGKAAVINQYGMTIQVPLTKLYKKAFDAYLQKKNAPEELSPAEIELAKIKAKLAELEAKQSAAELESEPVKVAAKKESKAKGIEIVE